jgi:hypothetical protein
MLKTQVVLQELRSIGQGRHLHKQIGAGGLALQDGQAEEWTLVDRIFLVGERRNQDMDLAQDGQFRNSRSTQ